MSVAEGVCDYCGRERLLETGDERSRLQFGKLWCGTCREGSRDRFKPYDNDRLDGQIEIMSEMLEQHPIRYEEPYDHIRMHMFKLDYQDEIWRIKRELEFRADEQTD